MFVKAGRGEFQVEVVCGVASLAVQLALQIPVDGRPREHVVFHLLLDEAAREYRVGVVPVTLEDLQDAALLLQIVLCNPLQSRRLVATI